VQILPRELYDREVWAYADSVCLSDRPSQVVVVGLPKLLHIGSTPHDSHHSATACQLS